MNDRCFRSLLKNPERTDTALRTRSARNLLSTVSWRTCGAVWITLAAMGCGHTNHEQATQLAQRRFDDQKAGIKYLLAREQFSNGQIDQARQTIQQALGLNPEDTQSLFLLAQIHFEAGDLSQAQQVLDHIRKHFIDPLEAAEQAGSSDEHTPFAPAETAQQEPALPSIANETLLEGRRGIETSAGISPLELQKSSTAALAARYHYLSGMVSERLSQLAEAVDHYKIAHQRIPEQLELLVAYCETLVTAGKLDEAQDVIRNQIDRFNHDGRLHMILGEIHKMQNAHSLAADSFKRAMAQFPNDPDLMQSYALELVKAERYAEALPHLQALKGDPDVPTDITLAIAQCHMHTGSPRLAHQQLEQLVLLERDNILCWMQLARCNLAMQQWEKADAAAREALELKPQNIEAQMLRGYALWKLSRFTDAAVILKSVIRTDPNNATAMCLLGQVCEALNDPETAQSHYLQAITIHPEDTLAQTLLEQLNRTQENPSEPDTQSEVARGKLRS